MIYSLQINAHGNRIVCKGTDVRNSYRVMFTGSYAACQAYQPIGRMVNERQAVMQYASDGLGENA